MPSRDAHREERLGLVATLTEAVGPVGVVRTGLRDDVIAHPEIQQAAGPGDALPELDVELDRQEPPLASMICDTTVSPSTTSEPL